MSGSPAAAPCSSPAERNPDSGTPLGPPSSRAACPQRTRSLVSSSAPARLSRVLAYVRRRSDQAGAFGCAVGLQARVLRRGVRGGSREGPLSSGGCARGDNRPCSASPALTGRGGHARWGPLNGRGDRGRVELVDHVLDRLRDSNPVEPAPLGGEPRGLGELAHGVERGRARERAGVALGGRRSCSEMSSPRHALSSYGSAPSASYSSSTPPLDIPRLPK